MPTYEYRCGDCGHEFERVQRITEDPIDECERCGGNEARRLISSGNFILKGSGWYSEGYGLGGQKKAGSTGDTEKPDASTSGASDPSPSSTSDTSRDEPKSSSTKSDSAKSSTSDSDS